MATQVVMEALSPTMEEGRLVEWKKNEGDRVSVGDVLAEVETDKAVMELVARAEGTLLKRAIANGDTVPVASVIGWIGEPGEQIPDQPSAPARPAETKAEPAAAAAKTEAPPAAEPAEAAPRRAAAPTAPAPKAPTAAPPQRAKEGGRVRASPLARRLAAERGLDLEAIQGSGPDGRVVKRDIEAAAAPAPPRRRRAAGPAFTEVPLSQIRKTIAKRLAQSIGPIPTFYLTTEIDMERAVDLREQLKVTQGDEGKVSFNDIVVRAVALALVRHPECNAWWQDDRIRYWNAVHIGMAVAVEDGLITPVIRDADQKPLTEIGAESRDLAGRARKRRLTPEEYTGATFSVSNLGMYDIEHFTAVINPPEAGIVAVGSITPVPVAHEGQVAVRRRMRVTMSCDHRVIDGATGAEFLKTLKELLEHPISLVV